MEKPTASLSDTHYLIVPKKEMLDDVEMPHECDSNKDFIVPKEELSNTSLHLDSTVLAQQIGIPIKIEIEHNPCQTWERTPATICNTDYLIKPKQETSDVPETTEENNADNDFIVPKKELSNTRLHLVNMVLPIKTETMLSKEIVKLQKAVNLSDDTETVYDTDMSTLHIMKTNIKQEPSLAKESVDNIQPVNDKRTVTSSNNTNPQFNSIGYLEYENVHALVSHMEENPYHCKHCDYKCSSSSDLKIHMRTHMRQKVNSCDLCDYKCTKSSDLKVHMRTHTGEKPFICGHCDFKCTNARYLKIHTMTHTGEKPYGCERCDYKCSTSWYLKIHMRTHTDAKPYFCEHCDYKCSKSCDLKIHMRKHTGEKPFVCTHCDYKCANSRYLKIHVRTHTGEKPFFCGYCDYKCSNSRYLKIHVRTHTGEKPYACEQCDYKCATSTYLKIHMRIHTGEKPYHCKHCDYKCKTSTALKCHMSTHTTD